MRDRVTPGFAEDFARRCRSIAEKRRNPSDVTRAMKHPDFKDRMHRLLDDLAADYIHSVPISKRPPFITIEVGTYGSSEQLRQHLLNDGCYIGDEADGILQRITLLTTPVKLDLYWAKVGEFGLSPGADWATIYSKVGKFGFGKCPVEVGPQLRRQYQNQPKGESLWVASEPIVDSFGVSRLFRVDSFPNDGRRCLFANCGGPDDYLPSCEEIVLCRMKQLAELGL